MQDNLQQDFQVEVKRLKSCPFISASYAVKEALAPKTNQYSQISRNNLCDQYPEMSSLLLSLSVAMHCQVPCSYVLQILIVAMSTTISAEQSISFDSQIMCTPRSYCHKATSQPNSHQLHNQISYRTYTMRESCSGNSEENQNLGGMTGPSLLPHNIENVCWGHPTPRLMLSFSTL